MPRRRSDSRLLQRAQDETQLRFGPEIRGLRALLAESRANLRLNIRAEKGAAAGIQAATRAAMPEIQRVYDQAGESAQQADADVARAMAGLSPSADSARAVAASESGAAKARLAEAMARAQADLGRRQVEAASGAAYGIRAAQAQHQGEVSKIRGQQRDLEQEAGLFASTTFRDLQDAERKFQQENRRIRISLGSLRNSQRSTEATITGIDPATGQPTAAERDRLRDDARADEEKKDKKGKPRFTPVQMRDARAMWDKAKAYAEQLESKGLLTDKTAERVALAIEKRGVKLPLAKAAVQVVLYGGVRKPMRRRIRRDYGLKPKVRRGLVGDVQDTVGGLYG